MINIKTKLERLLTYALIGGFLCFNVACSAVNKSYIKGQHSTGKTYALLFGGGTCKSDDFPTFYDSIKLMHDTFVQQKVDDIKVLYTGNQPDLAKIVQEDATEENIKTKLDEFSKKLTEDDTLLIYRVGHGFITWGDDGRQPAQSIMQLYGYAFKLDRHQKDKFITQDELKVWLSNIKAKKIILLHQCHAGGFTEILDDLKKTVVIASSSKTALTNKWKPRKYFDFVEYVAAAISGKLEGTSVNADADEDNLISVKEVFDFAKNNMPSSMFGFVEILPGSPNSYRTLKDSSLIKWSKDVNPSDVIIGNYAFKDKSLPSNKTLDLRQTVLKLIKQTVEKGERIEADSSLGDRYALQKGELIFEVYGKSPVENPKNIKGFVPLRVGLIHNLEFDPVTKKVRKQKVFADGMQVSNQGKFSLEGCDGIPDMHIMVEKYRDNKGKLIFNQDTLPIDNKVIQEYMLLVEKLLLYSE